MSNTVKFISTTIAAKPYAIQIAADNNWDSCLILPLGEKMDPYLSAQGFLRKGEHKVLSIEVLFTDKEGLTTIFGATYNKNLNCGSEEVFLKSVINEAETFSSFRAFISHLDKALCGGKGVLLEGKPDLVRVGIVNHWFSVGPCQIWEKAKDKVIDKQKISALLDSRPEVAQTNLNFHGVSFIFNQNEFSFYHWIKPQCGTKHNGYYIINKEQIFSLCSNILGD
jgi:hypothetical protein